MMKPEEREQRDQMMAAQAAMTHKRLVKAGLSAAEIIVVAAGIAARVAGDVENARRDAS